MGGGVSSSGCSARSLVLLARQFIDFMRKVTRALRNKGVYHYVGMVGWRARTR